MHGSGRARHDNRRMTTLLYTTPRLRVRRLGPNDADAMAEVYGDADAMRYVGDGTPLPASEARRWVDVTLANYAKRGYGMSAIEEAATGQVIGFCGLVHPGGQAEAEIKYALRRSHWGRGLATEAAAGLLAWGASAHGLRHVIATTYPANTASHRVLLKAGMRHGALRDNDDGTQTQVFEWDAPPAA